MKSFKFFFLTEESIKKLTRPEDNVAKNIYQLYEIEYKYSMIKRNKDDIFPKRYKNIIETLEQGAYRTSRYLCERFLPVFTTWLEHHAIQDPQEWAEKRYEDYTIDDDIFILDGFNGELERYMKMNNISKNRNSVIVEKLVEHDLNEFPNIKNMAEQLKKENIEELEQGNEDDKEMAEEMKEKEDVDVFVEMVIEVMDMAIGDFNFDMIEGSTSEGVWKELIEIVLFPLWYGYWSAEGIEETRKIIENVYEDVKDISQGKWNDSVNLLFSSMNEIINVGHQTGMLIADYGEEYGTDQDEFVDLSQEELERFSNLDPEKEGWVDDLKEMGINV